MTIGQLLRRPTGFVPLLLSASALALLVGYVAIFGADPNPTGDEGTAAHLFQLILTVQSFVMVAFGIQWLPRAARSALVVLALQTLAAAVPLTTLFLLEGRAG